MGGWGLRPNGCTQVRRLPESLWREVVHDTEHGRRLARLRPDCRGLACV